MWISTHGFHFAGQPKPSRHCQLMPSEGCPLGLEFTGTVASCCLNRCPAVPSATEPPPPQGVREGWARWVLHQKGSPGSAFLLLSKACALNGHQVAMLPSLPENGLVPDLRQREDLVTCFYSPSPLLFSSASSLSPEKFYSSLNPNVFSSRSSFISAREREGKAT